MREQHFGRMRAEMHRPRRSATITRRAAQIERGEELVHHVPRHRLLHVGRIEIQRRDQLHVQVVAHALQLEDVAGRVREGEAVWK